MNLEGSIGFCIGYERDKTIFELHQKEYISDLLQYYRIHTVECMM